MQAGPLPSMPTPEVMVDEMGVANPTTDISARIEYRFYKCQKCARKEFAGAMDVAVEVDCVCIAGPEDPKTKKSPHGKMKLYKYSAPRPGVDQTQYESQVK
jgi:hypothetical protein